MKLLICGSRKITDFDLAPHIPEDCDTIISGGAKGVDTIAEDYAKTHGIPCITVLPDYQRYGTKAAPIKRNEQMVDMADAVLAIWDEVSKGTKHTIDYAEKSRKQTTVIIRKI